MLETSWLVPTVLAVPKRTSPFRSILVIVALVLGVLAGCSSSGSSKAATDTGGSSASGGSSTNTVTIKNFEFMPKEIKVKAGTKVTWTNKDSSAHTATSDDGAPAKFDSGNLDQGKSFSFTFDKAGTYKYHCSIHVSMHGTVVVS